MADLLGQAVERYCAGDFVRAVPLFQRVLARDSANAIANHQLGLLAFQAGEVEMASRLLGQAVVSDPSDPEYANNLGVVLNAQKLHVEARAAFEQAIRLKPDYAHAFNNLGSVLEAQGELDNAIQTYRRALELDPGLADARDNLDFACAKVVPQWHFPMMRDAGRAEVYDRALRRAAPGRHVLDIGTGAGLLALMAARAGASHVTTCEAVPQIAARAREVIAANGMTDRITLHAQRSDTLTAGVEVPTRAEVLVTEVFASGILSEHVLPTLEHARANLLTPDATIIPCAASAWGYLVGGETLEGQFFAPHALGFDLTPFNLMAPFKLGMHLDRIPHDVLSDDVELLRFDLTQTYFAPERRTVEIPVTRPGRCIGVAQWMKLKLDPDTVYENRPNGEAGINGWMHVVYRFQVPVLVQPGDVLRVLASHNRIAMTVALAS